MRGKAPPARSRAAIAGAWRPARRSIRHLPQQAARDDEALNLRRAFADLADLRVSHHPLDGIVARVAVATVHLNCLQRRAHGELGAEQLRHGRLLRERLALLRE